MNDLPSPACRGANTFWRLASGPLISREKAMWELVCTHRENITQRMGGKGRP
ncbi:MAG: hypothetical protein ACXVZU_03675 [Methanobacteriaceae archaeon]